MTLYQAGSKWVYGNHGIGVVVASSVAVVEMVFGSCKVTLSHPAAARSLRPLLDAQGAEELLPILRAPSDKAARAWVSRAKAHRDRLLHGLPEEVAIIYRDIGRKEAPTYSERMFFAKARALLLAELTLIWGEKAEQTMREAADCLR